MGLSASSCEFKKVSHGYKFSINSSENLSGVAFKLFVNVLDGIFIATPMILRIYEEYHIRYKIRNGGYAIVISMPTKNVIIVQIHREYYNRIFGNILYRQHQLDMAYGPRHSHKKLHADPFDALMEYIKKIINCHYDITSDHGLGQIIGALFKFLIVSNQP